MDVAIKHRVVEEATTYCKTCTSAVSYGGCRCVHECDCEYCDIQPIETPEHVRGLKIVCECGWATLGEAADARYLAYRHVTTQ